ncbi:MAG: hypothetical protein ACRCVI_02165 [Mycoplasmoidaceae bacterium]
MTNIELLNEITNPNIDNPWIIAAISLLLIGVFLPCIIWFSRNFMRIILNKNYEWLNRALKWIFLAGLILFIISIILITLIVTGVIT